MPDLEASEIITRIDNHVREAENLGLPQIIEPVSPDSTMTVIVSKEGLGSLNGIRNSIGIKEGEVLSLDTDATLNRQDRKIHTHLTYPKGARGFGIMRTKQGRRESCLRGSSLVTNGVTEHGLPDIDYGDFFYLEIEGGRDQINYAIVPAEIDDEGNEKGHMLVAVTKDVQTLFEDNWHKDPKFRKAFVDRQKNNTKIFPFQQEESPDIAPARVATEKVSAPYTFWSREKVEEHEKNVGPVFFEVKPGETKVFGVEGDIKAKHAQVSRKHAKLSFQGPNLVVEDLDSKNGTLISGLTGLLKDEQKRAYVNIGDILVFAGQAAYMVANGKEGKRVFLAIPPKVWEDINYDAAMARKIKGKLLATLPGNIENGVETTYRDVVRQLVKDIKQAKSE